MRHLLTDLRGNPIFGRHRGGGTRPSQQRRYRHPNLPQIFYLVENRQWPAVLKRCKTHPNEIVLQDDANGNTPLHCACRQNPPADVIKALLAASAMTNQEGATALHIAATHRCSAEALSVLLSHNNNINTINTTTNTNANAGEQRDLNTTVNNNSNSSSCCSKTPPSSSTSTTDVPVAAAVSTAVTTHPTAVLTKTGRAPIHYACMSFRGLQVDAFRLLLETTLKEGMIVMDNTSEEDTDDDMDDFLDDLDEEDFDMDKEQQRDDVDVDDVDDDDHTVPPPKLQQQQQQKRRRTDVQVNVMTLRDATGQTPLGLLFRRYRERVKSVIQALEVLHREHATATNNNNNNPHRANLAAALRVQADLGELWEKARYMVARLTEERLQREGALLHQQEYYLGSPGDAMVAQEAAAWASEQHTATTSWWVDPNADTTAATTATAAAVCAAASSTSSLLGGDHPPRPFRIVHASVGLTGYGCPPEMIKLAISVHPHQVREMDEDGNLPLHVAAAASSFCMDTSMQQQQQMMMMDTSGSSRNPTGPVHDDAWETMSMVSDTTGLLSAAGLNSTTRAFDKVIKLLLQHYPDSAKIPHGKSGRLPLVLAFKRRTWEDGIKTLLYAYPAALHQPKVIPEAYMPRILTKIGSQAFVVANTSNENTDLTTAGGMDVVHPPPPPSTHHHWRLYNFLTRHQQLQQQQHQPQLMVGTVNARIAAITRRRGGSGVAVRGGIAASRRTPPAAAPTAHMPRGLTILFELVKSKPDLFTSSLARRGDCIDEQNTVVTAPLFSPTNAGGGGGGSGEITLSFA